MNRIERVFVYGALGLLLVANLSQVTGSTCAAAHAAVAAALEALGPAQSLTLAADGEKDVVLRNHKGRLAWTDHDSGKAYTVGFVHIGKVLVKLKDAKALTDERQVVFEELKKIGEDYNARLKALHERGQSLDQESPEFRAWREEFSSLGQEFENWGREANRRFEKLKAEQLEKCYRDLVNAVEVVGDRKGIDMVYRFIPTGEHFEAGTEEDALNAIRLRTVLKYPEGLDITPEVFEELSLSAD